MDFKKFKFRNDGQNYRSFNIELGNLTLKDTSS